MRGIIASAKDGWQAVTGALGSAWERALAWRQRHIGDKTFLFVAAFFTGLITGAGAVLLKKMISWIVTAFSDHFVATHAQPIILLLPLVGIGVAALITRYIVRQPMDHASERIRDDMAAGNYKLSGRLILGPIVACATTLGLGGSAGGEDPIAYTGAAVGSNVGKTCRMSTEFLMILVGCGAGAGIAGIFMAPIGGVMFTLEVLKMELSTVSVMALMVACLTAALTAYWMMGLHPDLSFPGWTEFAPGLLPAIMLLGVICGIYSIYYRYVDDATKDYYRSIGKAWKRWLLSGLSVALLVFMFPILWGEGYGTMSDMLANRPGAVVDNSLFYHFIDNRWLLLLVVLAVVLVKSYATSATNTGGGVGGDFTPTFFAGCLLGYLFAAFSDLAFGTELPMGDFALFAMAGVMAGSVRAPLMAIFISVEMTEHYSLILPVAIVAGISFAMVRLWEKRAVIARFFSPTHKT